ncbi:hypothetical protein [Rhodococcus pyridinivorans]|uniref:Uncharacterized protein n=1 Tax=Rhodococcus pyridinivorans AK37 TaxID=1114960 RepID=H0JL48_9NOCA|nr:hypothetical protein [Rhodococcus pyridinivorans]EHK86383.1 hypothetical protein AK37_01507 [Rhodococcus pyridinivorans AK37]MCD2139527.1 hypothetical protein [Rhodococcus pyridinivorans]
MPKVHDDDFEDEIYDDVEVIDADEYDDDPEPEVIEPPRPNREQRRKKKRSATTIPDTAPRPRDRQPKRSTQQSEAEDVEIILTLWDEELRIDRSAMAVSWDFQEGAVNKNPLQMVKGLLGQKQFGWFCIKARQEGLSPFEAANKVMELFAEEGGFESVGNS